MGKRVTAQNSKDPKAPAVVKRDFPFRRNNTYFIQMQQDDGSMKTLELPSVTTLLQATSNKSVLINWAAKQAAGVALAHPEMTIDEVVANSINLKKTAAMDIGTAVHKFAEDYNNGVIVDPTTLAPELQNYAKAFVSFMELHKPRVLFTEVCVFNATYGYAGTADLIAVLANGKTAILDWKTGKNTYKESHLQQIAYANAEWIYTNDQKVIPMPTIHEQYLVHLKDNGTALLIPVQEPFQKFVDVVNFYPTAKWLQEW
jgi:hypothetical protein